MNFSIVGRITSHGPKTLEYISATVVFFYQTSQCHNKLNRKSPTCQTGKFEFLNPLSDVSHFLPIILGKKSNSFSRNHFSILKLSLRPEQGKTLKQSRFSLTSTSARWKCNSIIDSIGPFQFTLSSLIALPLLTASSPFYFCQPWFQDSRRGTSIVPKP